VWIEEKDAQGTVTSVRRYLWTDGTQPAEERDGANAVLRRFYPEGEQAPGAAGPLDRLFYAKDHLGSVREVTDAAGVLRARYDYGFWGNRTRLSGDVETAVGYTGHHHHGKSGLVLTWYRAYDPDTGRWLSRDPIAEDGGLNLYGYVFNNPSDWIDPQGQSAMDWVHGALDAIGTFEPTPFADIINAAIYGLEGDKVGASISAMGVIPYAGDAGKFGKYGSKICKGVKNAAAEKAAKDFAKRIERDLGKEARRAFHNAKELGDRTLDQLKADGRAIYEEAGMVPPPFMR
jgi:RHS repeat-associated protein